MEKKKTPKIEKKPWFQIEAKAGKTAEIYLDGHIGKDLWTGEGVSAKEFIDQLNALKGNKINLYINSPGGSVFEGNAIYNALKAHKADVFVKIMGLAASISSVIAMSGDNIEMPKNAMMMIHKCSGLAFGNADDMNKMALALSKMDDGITGTYQDRTNMDRSNIEKMMSDETWMTAGEAVEFGFADAITESVDIQAYLDSGIMERFHNVPEQFKQTVTVTQSVNSARKESKKMEINLKFLQENHADIVEKIQKEAKASVDLASAMSEGAQTERDKILALAKVHFGDEKAEQFEAVVNTGATVEMYQAMKAAMPAAVDPEPGKPDKMGEMLTAIQSAGADNPGMDGGSGSVPGNFTEAWTSIKNETGCTTEAAMKAAVRDYPDLHKLMISRIDAGNA